jgi:hypothetical protein
MKIHFALLFVFAFPSAAFAQTARVESCGEHPQLSASRISGAFYAGTVKPDDSTDCVIRFSRLKRAVPRCVVTWRDNLPHMHYDVTKDYIAIVQSKASALIDYKCSDD